MSKSKKIRMRRDRIAKARQDKGLTQEDLAKRVGISGTQIYRIESENANTSAETLGRIAKELEVSVDYLMGLSDHPHGELTFKDLSPEEQRIITAYRQSANASDRIGNIFLVLAVNEDLMDELAARAKATGD